MNQLLRPDQIEATLRRHGLPEDTRVLGVSHGPAGTTVNLVGRRLIVPDDVLAIPAPAVETARRTLFSRPD